MRVLWGRSRDPCWSPQARPTPAHALATEDAPHLAAGDLDATLLGCGSEGIERPFWLGVWIWCFELAGQRVGGLARWRQFDQGEYGAALELGEARLAASARQHPQPVESLRIEGVQAVAHRFRMTAECVGDLAGALAIPAARDHLGVDDSVGGRVDAVGQLPNMALFVGVQWRASGQMYGHGTPPAPQPPAQLLPLLRNDALKPLHNVLQSV